MKRLLFFAFAVVFSASGAQQLKKDITVEDLFKNNTFQGAQFFPPESMNDGVHFSQLRYKDSYGEIAKYDYATYAESGIILKGSDLKPAQVIEGYRFSPDESKILIWNGSEQIYRHSTRENYYIYDLKTKILLALSDKGKQSYARFSPDGTKISFVRENNLFIRDLAGKDEAQVTTDGKVNSIINGATDWVYEEEFSMSTGFDWSADGSRIAYYRFDESNVKEFSMTKYGTLYPTEYKFKYPKAGENNSIVDVYVYDLKTKQAKKIDLGNQPDVYFPRIIWTKDPAVLSVQRLNRLQNTLDLYLVKFDGQGNSTSNIIMAETSDTYIEIQDHLTFLDNKKQFIWSSEKSGFWHFYLYGMDGKLQKQVTRGPWDIADLKGIDEKAGLLYYTSAETSPLERGLYCIRLDGTGKKKLSAQGGSSDAYFSSGMKYYIQYRSDANTPYEITLHTADGKLVKVLEDNKKLKEKMEGYSLGRKEFFRFTFTLPADTANRKTRLVFDPEKIKKPGPGSLENIFASLHRNSILAGKSLSLDAENNVITITGSLRDPSALLQVPVPGAADNAQVLLKDIAQVNSSQSEEVELNGWMIKPVNFDPAKKYPVFMTVYGGPGANTVNDAWDGGNYFWHQMLAEKGYIVVSVDNRGTGWRGRDFKHCTYRQLGRLETADQAEAAKYLGGLPYVDKTRIGIQGWSYGGYMSSLCITKNAAYFKMAIAVAPVTNWRYYDSIYTERYMGLPADNAQGYDDNSPVNYAKELKGKYLLVHGTADDNVHFQNSVEMVTSLVKANKQFDSFYYPDKAHSLAGGYTRLHLYNMMTNYILNNL